MWPATTSTVTPSGTRAAGDQDLLVGTVRVHREQAPATTRLEHEHSSLRLRHSRSFRDIPSPTGNVRVVVPAPSPEVLTPGTQRSPGDAPTLHKQRPGRPSARRWADPGFRGQSAGGASPGCLVPRPRDGHVRDPGVGDGACGDSGLSRTGRTFQGDPDDRRRAPRAASRHRDRPQTHSATSISTPRCWGCGWSNRQSTSTPPIPTTSTTETTPVRPSTLLTFFPWRGGVTGSKRRRLDHRHRVQHSA